MRTWNAMRVIRSACLVICLLAWAPALIAQDSPPVDVVQPSLAGGSAEKPAREIFVPFEELHVLLENQPQRILLTREEYRELLARARAVAPDGVKQGAALVAAEYDVRVESDRALWRGVLTVDVHGEQLSTIDLEMAGLGLRAAQWEDAPAAIGRQDSGRLVLFVQGAGRKKLTLEMTCPLSTSAAQQLMHFQVPAPAATRLRLTAPGNVEVKTGASVIRRAYDADANQTQFELLPVRGSSSLVLSLNNRQKQAQRTVVARSVQISEMTASYERLHATCSFVPLHEGIESLRLAAPDGFEVMEVVSPAVSRWSVAAEGNRRILTVQLREATTETIVLGITAVRAGAPPAMWRMPSFDPEEVIGHALVLGLLVDERLKAERLETSSLLPIDAAILQQALPDSIDRAGPGAPRVRAVAAWYAPQGVYAATAEFRAPAERLLVDTTLLYTLEDAGERVEGSFSLVVEGEPVVELDVSTPATWRVEEVTSDGVALPFERVADGDSPRIRIRLNSALRAGETRVVRFRATAQSGGWLGKWTRREVVFPQFAVLGAAKDTGAIALEMLDDLSLSSADLTGLTVMGDAEKRAAGLTGATASGGQGETLAYRYEARPFAATFAIERRTPRITARTSSFLRIAPDVVAARYELTYHIEQARVRELAFDLPADTPAAVKVEGLDGLSIKEYHGAVDGERRVWTVQLGEPRRGRVRLAVEFQRMLPTEKTWSVPIARAVGSAWQAGYVVVEGHAELDVEVVEHPAKVDVGELAEAVYQPGRRLVGAYSYVGDQTATQVAVQPRALRELPAAIVQQALLETVFSPQGESQTAARLVIKTKAQFLELRLPPGATLWSAQLDELPIKPQRAGDSLLISLAGPAHAATCSAGLAFDRVLQLVYDTPAARVRWMGKIEQEGPRLFLKDTTDGEPQEVRLADLQWRLYLPSGYRLVRTGGTMSIAVEPAVPTLGVAQVGRLMYRALGGDAVRSISATKEMARGPAPPGFRGAISLRTNPAGGGMPMSKVSESATPSPYYMGDDVHYFDAAPDSRDQSDKSGGEWERRPFNGLDPAGMPALGAGGGVQHGDLSDEKFRNEAPMAELDLMEQAADAAPGVPQVPAPAVPPGVDFAVPLAVADGEKREDAFGLAFVPQTKQPPPPARAALLQGVRSLRIPFDPQGESVVFQSLGAAPRLEASIIHRQRSAFLGGALYLGMLVLGMVLVRASRAARWKTFTALALAATLGPVLLPHPEWTRCCNQVFFGVATVTLAYAVWGLVALCWRGLGLSALWGKKSSVAAAGLLAAAMVWAPSSATAENGDSPVPQPVVVQVAPPPRPVAVPDDAVIVPFDPAAEEPAGPAGKGEKILVPYAYYQELWRRAYPEKQAGQVPPPAEYALAGAAFRAVLGEDDALLLEGVLEVELFVDRPVAIPLPLRGGVLSQAQLNGQPARLSIPQPQPAAAQQANAAAAPVDGDLVLLHVQGKKRHQLKLSLRMKVERQGGWRIAQGRIPAAPATSLSLVASAAGAEIRLSGAADRAAWETTAANEAIETSLATGEFSLQWRPKVRSGALDQGLTCASTGMLYVQEEGLRLVWTLKLQFRQSQRERFTLRVPAGYLIERVSGANVRGWEHQAAEPEGTLDVTLLKPARESETFSVLLWRAGAVGMQDLTRLTVPYVAVEGAQLHNGRLAIVRSPGLELRTVEATNARREDFDPELLRLAGGNQELATATTDSPLGHRPFEAYHVVSVPFAIRLEAAPVQPQIHVQFQTLVQIAERERTLESRLLLTVSGRKSHHLRLAIPRELELTEVLGPGAVEWAVEEIAERRVLSIHLASGLVGQNAVVLRGKLGTVGQATELPLPRLEALEVDEQTGQIAVEVDPAFAVQAVELKNCETVLLARVESWVSAAHRPHLQTAVAFRQADYSGLLRWTPRQPSVSCNTFSNVRVTRSAIEDVMLLDFRVRDAGIRQLSFLLPAWMRDARISVPLLRQKTIAPVANQADVVRVTLELQDEVMDQVRVLIEHDRLLTTDALPAPIPLVETGRTDHRYVALESAGRGEIVVEQTRELAPLGRSQQAWREAANVLGERLTQVYLVDAEATDPQLVFRQQLRELVETVGARIGLAQALLVVDEHGAYRGVQSYRVDNATEPFLEVDLPPGAELWTVRVQGDPVKPGTSTTPGRFRIPLLKTAAGDLDFEVNLKYGGQMPRPGFFSKTEFPLLKTVNIAVELSQVRLYLPENRRWFNFDGTMRLVQDEADLTAGFVNYKNRQTKRLLETLQGKDDFARARAANNLKQLSNAFAAQKGANYSNEGLNRELADNGSLLRQAEEQLGANASGKSAEVSQSENLNRFYEGQANNPSKNVVSQQDRNFDGLVDNSRSMDGVPNASTPQQQAGQGAVQDFDARWFAGNKLGNGRQTSRSRVQVDSYSNAAGGKPTQRSPAGERSFRQSGKQAAGRYGGEATASTEAGERKGDAAKDAPVNAAPAEESSPASSKSDNANDSDGDQQQLIQRYNTNVMDQTAVQQLEVNNDVAQQLQGNFLAINGAPAGNGGPMNAPMKAPMSGPVSASAAPVPTGLASLDVEIPVRGRHFLLTTPRGEVAVTARSLGQAAIERLLRVGCAALLLVAGWWAYRSLKRAPVSLLASRPLAILYVLLGVLLLFLLPLAGLALLVAGVVLLIRSVFVMSSVAKSAS